MQTLQRMGRRAAVVIENNTGKIVGLVGGVAASGVAGATAVDYSPLSSAVDVSTVVTAIIAMGALLVAPRVARWATKLIARFF